MCPDFWAGSEQIKLVIRESGDERRWENPFLVVCPE
jgi:hypothetical protein